MALQRGIVLTRWGQQNGANVPQATIDYAHQLNMSQVQSYEVIVGRQPFLDEATSLIRFGQRVRPVYAVTTEGIRKMTCNSAAIAGRFCIAEVEADASVFTAMRAAFQAAPNKAGTVLPLWSGTLDADGNIVGTEPYPLYHPFGNYTAAEVTALSAWTTAHGLTNGVVAAYFNTTPAQLSAWLQAHPRQQATDAIMARWTS